MIIADDTANPVYIAADLLSQAEHGKDSQVILLTTSKLLVDEVQSEILRQRKYLSRDEIIEGALLNSTALLVRSINEAIELSNRYAPEHLIINAERAEQYKKKITNAGSVFGEVTQPKVLEITLRALIIRCRHMDMPNHSEEYQSSHS